LNISLKVIKQGNGSLVAACDAELLGKTLKFGKITFHVRREFYGGSLVNVEEAIELIKRASNSNLIGSKIVEEALRQGLVHPHAILNIAGIPHTQIVRL
jgi:hypothetical protein